MQEHHTHVQHFINLEFVLIQRIIQRLSTPLHVMAPLSRGMCLVCFRPPTCRCSAAAACKGCGTRRGLSRTAQRPGVMVHGAMATSKKKAGMLRHACSFAHTQAPSQSSQVSTLVSHRDIATAVSKSCQVAIALSDSCTPSAAILRSTPSLFKIPTSLSSSAFSYRLPAAPCPAPRSCLPRLRGHLRSEVRRALLQTLAQHVAREAAHLQPRARIMACTSRLRTCFTPAA